MKELLFKNDFFQSEKLDDGSIVVTVLKDENNFFGINLEGCKFITNKYGFTNDKFTDSALDGIEKFSGASSKDSEAFFILKSELRNRMLNVLVSQL